MWGALQTPFYLTIFFKALSAQAARLDGPELTKLRMDAKRCGVIVSIGFTEGTVASLAACGIRTF